MFALVPLIVSVLVSTSMYSGVVAYWDIATTTTRGVRTDTTPRQSFFRWMHVMFQDWISQMWFWWVDWDDQFRRRRLCHVVGISIDLKCLSTGTLMNRRVVITAYNYLDIYMNRMHDLRIWALGRGGTEITPYRYRVHRVIRPIPKTMNPEHCHGPRCMHVPRDDVAIIWSLDQIYMMQELPNRYQYPYRAFFPHNKYLTLPADIWFAGSGFEYTEHVRENYKIFFARLRKEDIRDCSMYLPKYWGKFICILNTKGFPGIQNGGGFYGGSALYGVGCFEIRYNDVRLFVITDLRYYWHVIHHYAHMWPGAYYEYAYPQWGVRLRWWLGYEGSGNYPYIPAWQVMDDFYPLG